jgi:hypothetical protein
MPCEVYIYDSSGNYLSQLPLYCLDETAAQTSIIGLDWYDGSEGVQDANQPTLAIGVENGRLQVGGSTRTRGGDCRASPWPCACVMRICVRIHACCSSVSACVRVCFMVLCLCVRS